MGQGSAVAVVVLLLTFWPGVPLESRRSLVFGLLLLAGGGLVWLNGTHRTLHGVVGLGLGVGLWVLIQGITPLRRLLELGALAPPQLGWLALAVALALGLAALPRATPLNRTP
jgi:Ca2+-transporting ATPase